MSYNLLFIGVQPTKHYWLATNPALPARYLLLRERYYAPHLIIILYSTKLENIDNVKTDNWLRFFSNNVLSTFMYYCSNRHNMHMNIRLAVKDIRTDTW